MFKIRFLPLLILLIFPNFVFGQNRIEDPEDFIRAFESSEAGDLINRILEDSFRPTPEDQIALFNLWPETGSLSTNDQDFTKIYSNYLKGLRDHPKAELIAKVGEAIAEMEFMFPGAKWAFLGRDAALVGDAIAFFYASIGQSDRVVFLNGSGGTIRTGSNDLIRFMEEKGLDLENFETSYPYILVDYTSFNQSSQTKLLMDAAYRKLKGRMSRSDFRMQMNTVAYSDKFLDTTPSLSSMIGNHGSDKHPLKEFASREGTALGVYQLYPLTHQEPWHDTFQNEMGQSSRGFYEGIPGSPSPDYGRIAILAVNKYIYDAMSSPEMLVAVKKRAIELGYVFDPEKRLQDVKTRPTLKEIAASRPRDVKAEVSSIFQERISLLPIMGLSRQMKSKDLDSVKSVRELIKSVQDQLIEKGLEDVIPDSGEPPSFEALEQIIDTHLSRNPAFSFDNMAFNQRVNSSSIEIQIVLNELVVMIGLLERVESEYENYFTTNAEHINLIMKTVISLGFSSEESNQFLITYLTLVDQALASKKINERDYRRLVLYVLGNVRFREGEIDSKGREALFQGLEQLISESKVLKDILIERETVYRTSKKNNKRAQATYEELVIRGFLPRSKECFNALTRQGEAS